MNGFLKLTKDQRKAAIEQAAQRIGMPAKAVEKDWWVTVTLKALFISKYKDFMVFKGGTSLSKCWGLIERFSEDIDIGLAPEAFEMKHEKEPTAGFIKKLKQGGYEFTKTNLKAELEKQFSVLGIPNDLLIIEEEPRVEGNSYPDPYALYVVYPSLFDKNLYLADLVKIEVSVRTLKEPKAILKIQSLLYEVFPNEVYKEIPFEVGVVEAQRTFLEKMFLLHEEFQKPDPLKIKSERMSRHLYDLEVMMDKEPGIKALANTELYQVIIEHRKMYNTIANIDYTLHSPSKISFVPPASIIEAYDKDYSTMKEVMIYGNALEFNILIKRLNELQERFKSNE